MIVIDAPPVLPVADARVLCEMADVTIQVARLGITTKTALRRAHELLTAYAERPVGMVLNGVVEGRAPTMTITVTATSTMGQGGKI